MLPAANLAEIISNIAALQLEPNTAAQILAAVFAPLLRSSDPELQQRAGRPRSKPRTPRRKRKRSRPRVAAAGEPTDGPRERARAALRANPDATLTAVAKIARCSRSTVVNARDELTAEARKSAPKMAQPSERRQRAQRFLLDALARGPKQVSDVEEAAEKARVDLQALEQARAELGIVVSRSQCWGRAGPCIARLTRWPG